MSVTAKHHYYLITAALTLHGGLAFGGSEWHEKYIARLPEGFSDDELTQMVLKFRQYAGGEAGDLPGVFNMADARVFLTRERIKPTLAKQIIESRILPQLSSMS